MSVVLHIIGTMGALAALIGYGIVDNAMTAIGLAAIALAAIVYGAMED